MSTTRIRSDTGAPFRQWRGSAAELRSLAEARGLLLASGSPLADAASSGGPAPAGWPSELDQALPALAQPQLIIELFHEPPAGGALVRLYGREGNPTFTAHWHDRGLHHVGWPMGAALLERLALSTLAVAGPIEAANTAYVLDRAGFTAAIALADVLQERSLFAMLRGQAEPAPVVDALDLLAALLHPRARDDLRWMSARGHRIAPLPLAPGGRELEQGLARLADEGWVAPDHGRWLVLPAGRAACAYLAGAAGWLNVVRRERKAGPDGHRGWQAMHFAALRCAERIWTCEVAEITAGDFRICLGSSSSQRVLECVHQLFAPLGGAPAPRSSQSTRQSLTRAHVTPPEAHAAPKPPVRGAPAAPAGARAPDWYYSRDGRAVGPLTGADVARLVAAREITPATRVWNRSLDSWTSAAGAGLVPGASAAPRPRPPSFCSSCGAGLAVGKRFCTSCGAAVRA